MKTLLAAALAAFTSIAPARAAGSPAAEYHATAEDMAAIQDGIAGARKLAPTMYPNGIGSIDVALYDSTDLYIWTRSTYPLTKTGAWNGYNVYRTTHGAVVGERQMARCGGEARFAVQALLPAVRSHFLFTCSPMGAQIALQKKKRGSIYDTRESYLATMAHEYAHHYMDQELWQIPDVGRLAALVKKIPTDTSKTLVLEEAYAQLCELRAAKALYPSHYERLRRDLHPGSQDPHDLAMPAALEVYAAGK